jgi:hypothetical protein
MAELLNACFKEMFTREAQRMQLRYWSRSRTEDTEEGELVKCRKVQSHAYGPPKPCFQLHHERASAGGNQEGELYIGVILSMKPTAQCTGAAKTAQKVIGQLARAFHYRDRHVFPRLYKYYVRGASTTTLCHSQIYPRSQRLRIWLKDSNRNTQNIEVPAEKVAIEWICSRVQRI